MSEAVHPDRAAGRRAMLALGAILLLALALRLLLVVSTVYIWDEDREWIVLASSISFDPADLHLPLQGKTHPILSAYLMRLGAVVGGQNPLGYRLASMVAGMLTVLLAYRLARSTAGEAAGLTAAAIMAVGEYHVVVSSVAVDMVFYLMFAMLGLAAFTDFLRRPRPGALALTALCIGLGYMCNERAGLLLPICAALLLTGPYRSWLRRWETWAALALFLVVIAPDLLKAWLSAGGPAQRGFEEHLGRLSGIGLTAQPLAFYGKELVAGALRVLGTGFKDWAPEYPAMNGVLGASVLLSVPAVLLTASLRRRPEVRLWLAVFLAVMTLLLLLDTQVDEQRGISPQAWYWADLTLLPGALLGGVAVGVLRGWRRHLLLALMIAGSLYSVERVVARLREAPRYKVGAEPLVFWPRDDRQVDVRTGFLACVACDPRPGIKLERVDINLGGQWRDARPGEFELPEPGNPRLVRLRAGRDTRSYGLHYLVLESGGRQSRVAVYVMVLDEEPRRKPMFWVGQAIATDRLRPAADTRP